MWKKPLGEHISMIYLNEIELNWAVINTSSEITIFELLVEKLKNTPHYQRRIESAEIA